MISSSWWVTFTFREVLVNLFIIPVIIHNGLYGSFLSPVVGNLGCQTKCFKQEMKILIQCCSATSCCHHGSHRVLTINE